MTQILFHGDDAEIVREITFDFNSGNKSDIASILPVIRRRFGITADSEFYSLMRSKSMKFIKDKEVSDLRDRGNAANARSDVVPLSPTADPLHLVDLRVLATECIASLRRECELAALSPNDAAMDPNGREIRDAPDIGL